jgi:NAD+ diphosphatase
VAAETWGALHAAVFAQAKALHYWQSQSKFCGRCGSLMDLKTAGYNASCGACGLITYPQTHPAVIMCVSDGERILLGGGPALVAAGRFRRAGRIAGTDRGA